MKWCIGDLSLWFFTHSLSLSLSLSFIAREESAVFISLKELSTIFHVLSFIRLRQFLRVDLVHSILYLVRCSQRYRVLVMWALVSGLGELVAPSVRSPQETVRQQWLSIRRFVIDKVPEVGKGQVRCHVVCV
jgi:hypothetical protein